MMIGVVIPAFNPDERLPVLVESLAAAGLRPVIVVDDGSGPHSEPIFTRTAGIPGCHILRHERNRGKGCALKTGFRHVHFLFPGLAGVATADADGQHLPADVVKVCSRFLRDPAKLVLGTRRFTEGVPLKSLIGNILTRQLFSALTGLRISDTQTGLRCIPQGSLKMLALLPGERFEYETNVLLSAGKAGIGIVEEEIATVYLDRNRSSHFRPVSDSLQIFLLLVRFALASVLGSSPPRTAGFRQKGEA